MIAWGAQVSSSDKEYQNILKDYLQNLVICSYGGVEITWNFVRHYLYWLWLVIMSFFLRSKKRDLSDKSKDGEDSKEVKES